jgi:hypothetical protein
MDGYVTMGLYGTVERPRGFADVPADKNHTVQVPSFAFGHEKKLMSVLVMT